MVTVDQRDGGWRIGRIPHLHRGIIAGALVLSIAAARGNHGSIRRPGNGIHFVGMAFIDNFRASWLWLPHAHGSIMASRNKLLAVRRPGNAPDLIGMALVGIDVRPIGGAPDLHSLISAG